MDPIDPLEVLKDDLKEDNVEVQLDAVKSLDTVALALGVDRTVGELFPTLDKYCFPVEIQAARSPEAYSNTDALAAKEEVLAAIAEQLKPEFVDYVGGSKNSTKTILPLLEKLAMVEETVIRSCAVNSLNGIVKNLKVEDVRESALPILKNLSDAEWFTPRVSASYLTSTLYSILNNEQDRQKILKMHETLCNDDMPMVKNDAYKNLVDLIDAMDNTNLIASYTRPLLQQLTNELMENMRQSMVDIVKKIAEKGEEEKKQDIVTEFVKAAVEDDSWRVRKHLAEQLASICVHLDSAKVSSDIGPLYVKLLQDSEPQVRKSAILALEKIINTTDGQNFALPIANGPLQSLANDSVGEVREALADQIACLGLHLDQTSAKEKLFPILKKLASDESPLARLNLCSHLADVSNILGISLFEQDVLPLLKEVTVDQKWRVRNSIVKNIGQIGIQMGKESFSTSRLREILVQSLKDPASTVRDTATKQLELLNEKFGFDWMSKYLFEEMKSIYSTSGNYLHRMVPLKAVALMSKELSSKELKSEFQELLLNALEDKICNVRFTTCRVLKDVIPRLDIESKATFKAQLTKVVETDEDADVIFFAKDALTVA